MAYSNLMVRAWLRTPVVSDEWLPLDGILFYQHVRNDLGRQDVTVPGASLMEQPKGETMRGGRLPLDIVHARDWYYRCSWAQWGPHADGQDHWSKRFDMPLSYLIDFAGRRGKVETKSGAYKGYRMPVYYRSALWVMWYCVGDEQRIEELLSTVNHIGKKTAQGWGRVRRWGVVSMDADYSVQQDGRLMRGVPVYHLPGGFERKIGNYGVRPSYWDRRNQIDLAMP